MILDQHPDASDFPEVRGLRAIGYWTLLPRTPKVRYAPPWFVAMLRRHLPDPHDFVDPSWDPRERAGVIAYLRDGKCIVRFMGHSSCRFGCGPNGSACMSDGVFVWPEGFAHYLEVHDVRPPDQFVQHALRKGH